MKQYVLIMDAIYSFTRDEFIKLLESFLEKDNGCHMDFSDKFPLRTNVGYRICEKSSFKYNGEEKDLLNLTRISDDWPYSKGDVEEWLEKFRD